MADKVDKELASSLPVTVEKKKNKGASSDLMADKVDKKLAPLLPVTVEKKKNKDARLPAVQLASLWALLTAAVLVSSFVLVPAMLDIHPPSWMLPRDDGFMDAAGVAEEVAIGHALTWCSAAAAAAAALALLLPERRRRTRRALAYAALVVAATAHLMLARAVALILAADPGFIFFWIVGTIDMCFLAAGDIHCLVALLLESSEEESNAN